MKNPMPFKAVWLLPLLAFLLVVPLWPREARHSTAISGGRTFVDDAGREINVPLDIQRVLAAGPPASILLYTLAPQKMLGWAEAPGTEQRAFLAPPWRDLPEHGRLTGKGGTAKIEKILALKPDIILDIGNLDPIHQSLADRIQKQTGLPYVLMDGSLANTPETYNRLGELLGEENRASLLSAWASDTLDAAAKIKETTHLDLRPSLYYARGPKGLQTGLAGSINLEALSVAGVRNVAESAGNGNLVNVSLEQVLAWNPQYILVQDAVFWKRMKECSFWNKLQAVQEGRILLAPSLPFGWVDFPPGVNRLLGVRWLLDELYPLQTQPDFQETMLEFMELFFHVKLTGEQMAQILSPEK